MFGTLISWAYEHSKGHVLIPGHTYMYMVEKSVTLLLLPSCKVCQLRVTWSVAFAIGKESSINVFKPSSTYQKELPARYMQA